MAYSLWASLAPCRTPRTLSTRLPRLQAFSEERYSSALVQVRRRQRAWHPDQAADPVRQRDILARHLGSHGTA